MCSVHKPWVEPCETPVRLMDNPQGKNENCCLIQTCLYWIQTFMNKGKSLAEKSLECMAQLSLKLNVVKLILAILKEE